MQQYFQIQFQVHRMRHKNKIIFSLHALQRIEDRHVFKAHIWQCLNGYKACRQGQTILYDMPTANSHKFLRVVLCVTEGASLVATVVWKNSSAACMKKEIQQRRDEKYQRLNIYFN